MGGRCAPLGQVAANSVVQPWGYVSFILRPRPAYAQAGGRAGGQAAQRKTKSRKWSLTEHSQWLFLSARDSYHVFHLHLERLPSRQITTPDHLAASIGKVRSGCMLRRRDEAPWQRARQGREAVGNPTLRCKSVCLSPQSCVELTVGIPYPD